jgi:NADH-quinone oxidoreductase subunit L
MNIFLWGAGAVAAGLTAFYMFRLVFMTFFGKTRLSDKAYSHLHESPFVIVFPLIVLALLSTVGGYLGVPKLLGEFFGGIPNYMEGFLEPVFAYSTNFMAHAGGSEGSHSVAMEWGLMGVSVLIACSGIALAWALYIISPAIPQRFTQAFPVLHRAVYRKWYVDEIYDFVFVNPCKALGNFLWRGFDVLIVDGVVNGVASLVRGLSSLLRHVQTGMVHNYAFSMALGVVVILGCYLFR